MIRANSHDNEAGITTLDPDLLSTVFSFLNWKEILKARVCRQWKEAATLTAVPQTFHGLGLRSVSNSLQSILGLRKLPDLNIKDASLLDWIPQALPRIPAITIDFSFGAPFSIQQGQESQEGDSVLYQSLWQEPTVDLHCLSNFKELRLLTLHRTNLNGKYPFLFKLSHLRSLDVSSNPLLQWDLQDLSGLPNLQRLKAVQNASLTGTLTTLALLRHSLIELRLLGCDKIEGSIHDLADFPRLEAVDVSQTNIVGDLRKLRPYDFPAITTFIVGDWVYGSKAFQCIEDAALLMQARYYLKTRTPELFRLHRWNLSETSPYYYGYNGVRELRPPFWIEFVQAEKRIGWRWTNATRGGSCETSWLDPEPLDFHDDEEEEEDYARQIKRIDADVGIYKGFLTPPTAVQHAELLAFLSN